MKRNIRSALRAAVGLALAAATGLVLAQDLIVKKEAFTLPSDGVTQIGLAAKPIADFLAR